MMMRALLDSQGPKEDRDVLVNVPVVSRVLFPFLWGVPSLPRFSEGASALCLSLLRDAPLPAPPSEG